MLLGRVIVMKPLSGFLLEALETGARQPCQLGKQFGIDGLKY
jgi:hypothetical protein